MNKRLLTIATLIMFVLPVFLFSFTYLSDEEYKKLSSAERNQYNADLQEEMVSLQQRKTDALALTEQLTADNERLRTQIGGVNTEILALYDVLGITEQDLTDIHNRIQYYKDQLNNWERMSDDDLWANAKAFRELREDYNITSSQPLATLPEFQRDWTDLNRRFTRVGESIDRIGRTKGYYEDNYTVQRGETLPIIAGHDFIYGDSSKWGIIFRANRDILPNPNAVREGQNLRIPRGLPTSWKVFRGESLWKISQYPEVYGTGTKWPTIYRANRDKIRDPDLIFPNQVFTIPRDN